MIKMASDFLCNGDRYNFISDVIDRHFQANLTPFYFSTIPYIDGYCTIQKLFTYYQAFNRLIIF